MIWRPCCIGTPRSWLAVIRVAALRFPARSAEAPSQHSKRRRYTWHSRMNRGPYSPTMHRAFAFHGIAPIQQSLAPNPNSGPAYFAGLGIPDEGSRGYIKCEQLDNPCVHGTVRLGWRASRRAYGQPDLMAKFIKRPGVRHRPPLFSSKIHGSQSLDPLPCPS